MEKALSVHIWKH